ncbi:ADP/ATP carrier protein, partial [Coemansia helicoidea]
DRLRVFFAGLAASVVSKGVSATLNAPVERSRMLLQLQGFPGHIPRAQRYSGVVSALGRIPREQGAAALWRGNLASVLRAVPPYCLNAVLAGRYKALFPRYSS